MELASTLNCTILEEYTKIKLLTIFINKLVKVMPKILLEKKLKVLCRLMLLQDTDLSKCKEDTKKLIKKLIKKVISTAVPTKKYLIK